MMRLAGWMMGLLGLLTACNDNRPLPLNGDGHTPLVYFNLAAPLDDRQAELSGLDWYGDKLVLLPEKAHSFSDNHLFYIKKTDLLAALQQDDHTPLMPQPLPLEGDLSAKIDGYQGYEALAFYGDDVYLVLEAGRRGVMSAWLLRGRMQEQPLRLLLDTLHWVQVPLPVQLNNMAIEAMLVADDGVRLFFEANGSQVNPRAVVYHFSHQLDYLGTAPLPAIEYRVTDATRLLADSTFWLLNYHYPGETPLLRPADDRFLPRTTPNSSQAVERLLKMRLTADGVVMAQQEALLLAPVGTTNGRNWEGLVMLDSLGFIIVSDMFPATLLAFLPLP